MKGHTLITLARILTITFYLASPFNAAFGHESIVFLSLFLMPRYVRFLNVNSKTVVQSNLDLRNLIFFFLKWNHIWFQKKFWIYNREAEKSLACMYRWISKLKSFLNRGFTVPEPVDVDILRDRILMNGIEFWNVADAVRSVRVDSWSAASNFDLWLT